MKVSHKSTDIVIHENELFIAVKCVSKMFDVGRLGVRAVLQFQQGINKEYVEVTRSTISYHIGDGIYAVRVIFPVHILSHKCHSIG